MVFAGNITASPYKSDIYGLSLIPAASYSAVPDMMDLHFIQRAGYYVAAETSMDSLREDSSMVQAGIRRVLD